MGVCWTCGSVVSGYHYTCPVCDNSRELKMVLKDFENYNRDISNRLDNLAGMQQKGFQALKDTLSLGLSEVANAIEWGFGEISWQLQNQASILRNIDYTLKTPSETRANEWRLHAEELRRRGLLEESEEFFLKALNEYRLDYRVYVGLAETYLRMNKFDQARFYLEKSLPHAPKERIDYKSYSYKLIGHIYACEEDCNKALSVLRTAIELSPNYEDAHYDYAQYCALTGRKDDCLDSLKKAVLGKPVYFYLAQRAKNFDPFRRDVQNLLISAGITEDLSSDYYDGIYDLAKYSAETGRKQFCILLLDNLILKKTEYFYLVQREVAFKLLEHEIQALLTRLKADAYKIGEASVSESKNVLKDLKTEISQAHKRLKATRTRGSLQSKTLCEQGQAKLGTAEEKLASGDYLELLKAQQLGEEAKGLFSDALKLAVEEQEKYRKIRSNQIGRAWSELTGSIFIALGLALSFAIFGFLIGIFADFTIEEGMIGGSALGGALGILGGMYKALKEIL